MPAFEFDASKHEPSEHLHVPATTAPPADEEAAAAAELKRAEEAAAAVNAVLLLQPASATPNARPALGFDDEAPVAAAPAVPPAMIARLGQLEDAAAQANVEWRKAVQQRAEVLRQWDNYVRAMNLAYKQAVDAIRVHKTQMRAERSANAGRAKEQPSDNT